MSQAYMRLQQNKKPFLYFYVLGLHRGDIPVLALFSSPVVLTVLYPCPVKFHVKKVHQTSVKIQKTDGSADESTCFTNLRPEIDS